MMQWHEPQCTGLFAAEGFDVYPLTTEHRPLCVGVHDTHGMPDKMTWEGATSFR